MTFRASTAEMHNSPFDGLPTYNTTASVDPSTLLVVNLLPERSYLMPKSFFDTYNTPKVAVIYSLFLKLC
jgi:hypothetical protein